MILGLQAVLKTIDLSALKRKRILNPRTPGSIVFNRSLGQRLKKLLFLEPQAAFKSSDFGIEKREITKYAKEPPQIPNFLRIY